MEIQLKNIYVYRDDRNQPLDFVATLEINQCNAGLVSKKQNSGGAIFYHPFDGRGNNLIHAAEAWCRKLRPAIYPDTLVAGKPMMVPMELEIYLGCLLEDWLNAKALARWRLKMEINMRQNILYGVPGKGYRRKWLRMPLAAMVGYPLGIERLKNLIQENVLPEMGKGEMILNTNIPGKVIKKLGIGNELIWRPGGG